MITEQHIVLADDHPIVRHGLRMAIEVDPLLKIVAEAADGEAALKVIQETNPQLVVLDIDMPKKDGLEVARELQRLEVPVGVIFLTIHDQEDLFHAAMDLGARGYILKESALIEIVSGLRTVAAGQYYVSAALTGHLMHRRTRVQALEKKHPGFDALSPTERRVLQMVAQGKSSKQIADEMFIHFRTVENHRTSICQKLGLRGPHTLLRFALQHRSDL